MKTQNGNRIWLSTSILAALAASLCCITPLVALVAGVSGAVFSFSWLEPARPYLVSLSVVAIGFAWYRKIKTKNVSMDCACDDAQTGQTLNKTFWQSTTFLAIITITSALLVTFPYYSQVFFLNNKDITQINTENLQQVELKISGMTCTSCEEHVRSELEALDGVAYAKVSYEKENAVVGIDKTKVTIEQLKQAVAKAGYELTNAVIEPAPKEYPR